MRTDPSTPGPVARILTLSLLGASLVWVALLRRKVRDHRRLLIARSGQLEAASTLALDTLAGAYEAEALEQSRRRLLELVANDDPLETILTVLAKSVEKHSQGVVCTMDIQHSHGAHFVVSPPQPFAAQIESAALLPNRRLTVPVLVDGRRAGHIAVDSISESGLTDRDTSLFRSWSQFASLALERRGLYEKLFYRAEFDALTKLHNRVSLHERLTIELASAQRDGDLVAVLYMDLNGFKTINDTYGHDAGDQILKEAADRIRKGVRRSDIVARLGGDEFVVVLSHISAREEAERIGSLLRSSLSQPIRIDSHDVRCGASLGIALYPLDCQDVETLLNHADSRMYAEKGASHRQPDAGPIEVAPR